MILYVLAIGRLDGLERARHERAVRTEERDLRETLPRTATGKIQRFRLRELAAGR